MARLMPMARGRERQEPDTAKGVVKHGPMEAGTMSAFHVLVSLSEESMAPRRKSGPITHAISIAAASLAVVALAGVLSPAPERDIIATAQTGQEPLRGAPPRPSYIVPVAHPAQAAPSKPVPALASLSVQPVATPDEPAPEVEKRYVTAGALNVRAGPSSASEQIAALPMGTEVEVRGNEGRWLEITAADGVKGWAFAKYLSPAAP